MSCLTMFMAETTRRMDEGKVDVGYYLNLSQAFESMSPFLLQHKPPGFV